MRFWLTSAIVVTSIVANTAASETRVLVPGLEVTEYPRHLLQKNLDQVYLTHEKFGEPIGETAVTKSLANWKWNRERNAISRGFLTIERDGDYAFTTNSFYDRNVLFVDGRLVCKFADGGGTITTIPLKKGKVEIVSVGYVESRGSADVRWRPPGQRELSAIPADLLRHYGRPEVRPARGGITIVAKDFVLEIYKNGKRISDSQRKLLLDRFGATAERVDLSVKPGDWLVFHVANNRLRHKGTKYFALSGSRDGKRHGIVSNPDSPQWSVCDDPVDAREFIRDREEGTEARAVPIPRPWEEGDKFMRQFAGDDFPGRSIWGAAPSTWIKYVVPGQVEDWPGASPRRGKKEEAEKPHIVMGGLKVPSRAKVAEILKKETAPKETAKEAKLAIEDPKRRVVQVLSATYGTGGRDADVTAVVKKYVEERKFFAANPGHLKADPNPGWNKGLHIVYMKDGVRREQRRNENEHILPESFYGPHDPAELEEWIEGTRWSGPKGEIQFQEGKSVTGSRLKSAARWKALGENRLRITWGKGDQVEFRFDYVWSSFSDPKNGKNVYRIVK